MKKKTLFKLKSPKKLKKLNAIDAGNAALGKPFDIVNMGKKPVGRRKFQHYTGNGNGDLKKIDAPAKDGMFRTVAEGRAKNVMPKLVKIKTKPEVWTAKAMLGFLLGNHINMGGEGNRWFIAFDEPARKMTAQDQLDLMSELHDSEKTYFVQHNLAKKHVIIAKKAGEDE